VTAFGKLVRTTAFRLTLVYLFLFALFAASLLGYFAWNTRRLITEQITGTVNAEIGEISEIYGRRGLRGLVFTIENRALRPGANLYLVTTPTGQAIAGNVGSLAPGVMGTRGWSETVYRRLDDQDEMDHRALVHVTELSNGFRLLIGRDLDERRRLFGIVAKAAEVGVPLHRLPLATMREVEPRISEDVFSVLSVDRSVRSRTSFGGTAPKNVRAQARKWLRKLEKEVLTSP